MLNEQTSNSHSISAITYPGVVLSNHAKTRAKQRGIKQSWICLILEYGRYTYQNGKHTYTVSLNKPGIQQIKKSFGQLVELSKLRRLYLILSDDSVIITCAYR